MSIKKTISSFPWKQTLAFLNSAQQVKILNETILNIMANFVPNKIKTFRPSEPPWFNQIIRSTLKKQTNKLYNRYNNNGFNEADKLQLDNIKSEITKLITNAKETYLKIQGNKLADQTIGRKTYWRI